MKKIIITLVFSIAALIPVDYAATLIMKDGKTLSKVKVISINFEKRFMVVESDGKQKNFPLGKIAEFYTADSDIGNNSFDVDNSSEYDVNITKVDMPKKGYKTSHGKKRSETSSCEITYSIRRVYSGKDDETNKNVVKEPYFYLAVLTEGSGDYGARSVFRYTYPSKRFKLDSKSKKVYNKADIMESVGSFKRGIINFDRALIRTHGSSNSLGGDREIEIELKGVKNRYIIAYHLEVWGKDKIVAEKNWNDPGVHFSSKAAQRWWLGH